MDFDGVNLYLEHCFAAKPADDYSLRALERSLTRQGEGRLTIPNAGALQLRQLT